MSSPHQHHLRAILYSLVGVTFWSLGDTNMKLAAELGVPKQEIMALAGVSGMAIVFLAAALRRDLKRLRMAKPSGIAWLCLCNTICFACWLMGLPHMPMADYYTIIFLMPMVVAGFAALVLKEPLGWKKALAILAGFLGVIVAVGAGDFAAKREPLAYFAVFMGMLSLSVQMILVRILGARESREAMAFYPRIAAIVIGLVACCIWGFGALTPLSLTYCLIYGTCGGAGWLFVAEAYKHAPASTVVSFQYSQIITGGLLGYLIWHDQPTAHLILGAAIIIASGLYIAAHSRMPKTVAETA